MGKLKFSLEQYQEAAHTFRAELLMLPLIGVQNTLQYMTARPGIRYAESVGEASVDAEFAPYKADMEDDADLDLNFRTLYTYFGACVKNFEPNSAISTLLGKGATKTDGQMQTPTALAVLALIAKGLSYALNRAIWNAVRNPQGKKTKDLFDGFDTIAAKEIDDGNISQDKGNLVVIDEKITAANAVSVAKKIMYAMDEQLREQKCYLYCTQHFVDMYNEGYKMESGCSPFYNEYRQLCVEGSNGNLIFCPLSNKAGSEYFQVSTKENMLVGYDQMGDVESVEVARFKAFILQYIATMFFGVQYESIDRRRLLVVHVPKEAAAVPEEKPLGPQEEGDKDGEND